jgi:hypothetical protein
MGCVSGYCSNGANILISKDKHYSATIISNILTNPIYSNKTNNKLISLNSERPNYEPIDKNLIHSHCRQSFSNKELKIPDNPLPFVKIKPKKSIY